MKPSVNTAKSTKSLPRAACLSGSLFLFFLLPLPVYAQAEPLTLSLGADFAAPVAGPITHRFHPGAAATVAVHQGITSWFAFGGRVRAGVLADSPQLDASRMDAGIGVWGSAFASARFQLFGDVDSRRASGALLELNAGVAVTGPYVEPAAEAGIGFGFPIDVITLVPTVRIAYIAPFGAQQDSDGAWVGLVGADVVLFDRPSPPPPVVEEPEPPRERVDIPEAPPPCPLGPEDMDGFQDDDNCLDADDDQDGILDTADACPRDAEVINGVDDTDGCPDSGLIELVEDRIVLDDRVFFETGRAHIRHEAIPTLQAIATLIRQHTEWARIRIEGHADARGSEALNQRLSERRAQSAMKALIELGIPADQLEAIGFGESRLAHEDEHHQNRRVEFLVVRHVLTGAP